MKHVLFPREYARTKNYSLGAPRTIRVSRRADRLFFLRSSSGDDERLSLWFADVPASSDTPLAEVLLVDTAELASAARSERPDPLAERLRRERVRESAKGITSYTIDGLGQLAAFALSGDVFVVDCRNKIPRKEHTWSPGFGLDVGSQRFPSSLRKRRATLRHRAE